MINEIPIIISHLALIILSVQKALKMSSGLDVRAHLGTTSCSLAPPERGEGWG